MTSNQTPGHAMSDADLIAYLDGEMEDDERASLEAALATDTALADRLETLSRRGRRLGQLLAAIDPSAQATRAADPTRTAGVRSIESARTRQRARGTEPPAGRGAWQSAVMRAAAIVIALIGTALLVPPVRAWIGGVIQRAFSDEEAIPTTATIPDEAPIDTLTFVLPAAGPEFEIELATTQAGGRLEVRRTTALQAALDIRGRLTNESSLVLPHGLRINNAAGSTADYAVAVPPAVSRVHVRIGGTLVRTLELSPDDSAVIAIPIQPAGAESG